MFVVTLFSTVSANNWGNFKTDHCTDHAPDAESTGACLRRTGNQIIGNRWPFATCADSFGAANGKPGRCGSYHEAMFCCGSTCNKEAASETACSSQGGLPQGLLDAEGECDSNEPDSCVEFQTLIKEAKNLEIPLECVNDKCVPKDGPPEDDKQTTKKPTTDKNDENNDNSNAFAMGLSTLAGFLLFLQF